MQKTVMAAAAIMALGLALMAGCGGGGGDSTSASAERYEIIPGLTAIDSVIGSGAEVQPTDFVEVHYSGFLVAEDAKGEPFDSSVERGEPIAFPLGKGFVIPGWDRGLQGMKVGGKRTLIIDSELAYGAQGRPPTIPGGASLWFDCEMVNIYRVEAEITEVGAGEAVERGDNISVHYTGWTWVDGAKGEKFDSSHDRGQPYSFTLGMGMVIPGWDLGLEGMTEGTKATLIIPSPMAYGKRGMGPIQPDSDLIFDVELVGINQP